LTDKNFGIYNHIENKNRDIMKELNIKEKDTIGNNEILFQDSPIINIKMTKDYFIVVTNEEINFYEREKYNKINIGDYKSN
jgi:hypothetical protein